MYLVTLYMLFNIDDWSICDTCGSESSVSSRNLQTLGPARRVAEMPFLIVTGSVS